jgi:assimilatory nitrate reductase electron transfer subunit
VTRLVVVGNGMVGARFVEDLLTADSAHRFDVTVVGAEGCEPYNRVLLSEVVAAKHDLAALTLPTPVSDRLTVLRGRRAVRLDRTDRLVETDDGGRLRYDRLVLATGAHARVPPLPGLRSATGLTSGVHALRTIDDAREIVAATLNARHAVVLGGGVLGMEAACGLTRRGVGVTVVHPAEALMERQLDAEASRVVESAMSGLGIDQRVGTGAVEALTEGGRLTGLLLDDGSVLPADLLVLATGTAPDVALASAAGLAVDRGVVVGDDLACAADHRVAAIGDCAQPPEGASGLVAQGWEQSRRLAARLCGAASDAADTAPSLVAPAPASDVVRLKAHGLDVVTMGVCGIQRPGDPSQRTLRLSDPDVGRHVELVVSGGLLVGATCVGAGPVAAELVTTYTRRFPVPADPAHLLLSALASRPTVSASYTDLPDDATVCRCNGVTKGAIAACVTGGAGSVQDVAAATRATTGCGGCAEDVCSLLAALRPTAPPTAPTTPPTASPTTGVPREDDVTKGKHMIHSTETAAS